MENALLAAILFVSALLAIGLTLRVNLRFLQVLYIPASVVAGVIGFALVQVALRYLPTVAPTKAIAAELGSWPGWLIAVVFAGLLLEGSSEKGFAEALKRGARSGILAWIIILGQIAIGLFVYLLFVRPAHPDVPASFGQLLEVSWAGGHGTSSAMGQVYAAQGFREGKDLAYFLATVGLIYGVISGLTLVNLAVRRGWTRVRGDGGRIPIVTGLEPSRAENPPVTGHAKTRGEVMDPMVLQVIILAAAFGVGWGYQQAFFRLATLVLGKDDPMINDQLVDFAGKLPLFLFTLLGGLTARRIMELLGVARLIDVRSIQRLVGVSMEFLIVAAIVTMRVEALTTFFLPVIALVVLAGIWTSVCLLVLARKLLPSDYWFELGLLNYGFATANTPQGLMLLRIVDPDLRSGAAEDYAVAAPLSAPFVGGGIVTFALPVVLKYPHGAGYVLAACVVSSVVLYALGTRIGPKSRRHE